MLRGSVAYYTFHWASAASPPCTCASVVTHNAARLNLRGNSHTNYCARFNLRGNSHANYCAPLNLRGNSSWFTVTTVHCCRDADWGTGADSGTVTDADSSCNTASVNNTVTRAAECFNLSGNSHRHADCRTNYCACLNLRGNSSWLTVTNLHCCPDTDCGTGVDCRCRTATAAAARYSWCAD